MSKMNRREYITRMAGAGALVGAMGNTALAATRIAPPVETTIGQTGIKTTRLAMGTGYHGSKRQSDHTRMGFQKLVSLFQHSYDRGIRFFDMADLYGTHLYCREALRSIPRDKVTLLTKMWWQYDSKNPSELPADYRYRSANKALERFMHELAVDMVDIVLLHCLVNPDWNGEMQPYMDALSEAKQQGKIRAVGVSCHNFGAMKTAAETPWVDIILARINPYEAIMDGTVDEVVGVLKTARANGKGVIGMKIFGAGKLLDKKDECMKFAQTNGVLDAMTIGATEPEQVDENLFLMQKYPVA